MQVTATAHLTPRMRRITLPGPSLVGLVVGPAQDVELILGDGAGHRLKRRYTVRSARPDLGEIDIDALVHPDGPGGRWAAEVAISDRVEFIGPRGHLEVRPADWHLFLGDEAALPAIASLLDALPVAELAIVLAEVSSSEDEVAIGVGHERLQLCWLHRAGARPGSPDLFRTALAALATPSGTGQAYLLGESRAVHPRLVRS